MKYYILGFKRAFDFKGKSSRSEFWYFFLFDVTIHIILGFLEGLYGKNMGMISTFYSIIIIIPYISLGFRRLNDAGYNKFLFLIPLANLFFASMKTKE